MIGLFDYNFLKMLNKDTHVSRCSKCEQFGHREVVCQKERVFNALD